MKISIDKHWLGRYEFYRDTSKPLLYSAKDGNMIFQDDYVNIYNAQDEKVMDLRHGKSSLLNLDQSTFIIKDYKNGSTLEVKCRSYKHGHWFVNYNQNNYDLYLHGRIKKSYIKTMSKSLNSQR